MIQEQLQKEEKLKYSEKFIVSRDKSIKDKIHVLLESIFKYSQVQMNVQQWTRKARSSLEARLEQ